MAFNAKRLSAPIKTLDSKPIDKAQLERRILHGFQPMKLELPLEPRSYKDLQAHPLGGLFQDAELQHLETHRDMNSWTEINQSSPKLVGKQILDCM